VYDSDPRKNPQAQRFERITYDDVIEKQLQVMDLTAVTLARDSSIPIVVFAQKGSHSLADAVCGEGKFTIIQN
jgi:uridylate kinase